MLEDEPDDSFFVVLRDCCNESVVMFDGCPQALTHIVIRRPEEGVADAGVVDQQPAEARLKIGIARHLTDDLVEPIVLQYHGQGVA